MAEFVLQAQERTIVGKRVKRLRNQGIVPINVYGAKIDPIPLQVQYRDLEVTLLNAGGTNLIQLAVGSNKYNVLAREVQRDVIKGDIHHADFVAIDENARIDIEVPIVMVGESPAVAARKGILLTGPNTLSIETVARNIINEIEVDLSTLVEVGDSIYVHDLNLGEEVVIHNDPDEMIARVSQSSAARREEALEALDNMVEGEEMAEVPEEEVEEEVAEEE